MDKVTSNSCVKRWTFGNRRACRVRGYLSYRADCGDGLETVSPRAFWLYCNLSSSVYYHISQQSNISGMRVLGLHRASSYISVHSNAKITRALRASSNIIGRSHTLWNGCSSTQADKLNCFSTSQKFRQSPSINKSGTASGNLPLSGITVVALEQAIAGPFCTRQLADLGARIIKIERPGKGDFNRDHDQRVKGLCSHFVWTNRSKESLALDLKQQQDLDALKKILSKADVLVQNLAPGATERMGLGYETLKQQHPRLIV